ncbi:hypothetical protein [uncultured Roseobacter sp.]|uniref:hypothetical protein n=1 Tax=uncultured Roseobacter sp. TaxID=114847 RepID=UPI0026019976|nr:hypothetical protein [uncultured Roseobacter sp.]
MNLPIAILSRAFRLIFAQPRQTLRVILPGVVTYIVGGLLVGGAIFLGASMPVEASRSNLLLLALTLPGFAILLRGFSLFAVMWHRHALVPDHARDDVMKPVKGTLNRYLWRCALLVLLLLIISLPIGFVGGVGTGIAESSTGRGSWVASGINTLISIVISWIGLRLSLMLPAVSVGDHMGITQSWAATRAASKDLFWTAALLGILNASVWAISVGVLAAMPFLGLALAPCIFVFQSLLYLSVLSTLYGHLIEGRPLT